MQLSTHIVLLVTLASAYSMLRKLSKSPCCTPIIMLMERNLLDALISLGLQKRVEGNMTTWHLDNGDMTSQATVTSFWNQRAVFATSSSPRDPRLYCTCRRPLSMTICAVMCSFH